MVIEGKDCSRDWRNKKGGSIEGLGRYLAFCRLSMAVCSCERCLGSASSESTSSTMLPSSSALSSDHTASATMGNVELST